MRGYVKDLLSTSKTFVLDENNNKAIFPSGEEFSCVIKAKDNSNEYFFIGIRDYDDLDPFLYYGVFKKNSEGSLYEIEPEGKNREKLNSLDVLLNKEIFDAELLSNNKILVLAIKFLINHEWDAIIYELEERQKMYYRNNPSDFIL